MVFIVVASENSLRAAPSAALHATTMKTPPAASTAIRWVKPHTGARDARGALVRFPDAPAHFRPNLTPRQMLQAGMHGGIYFNPLGGKPGILYPRGRYPKGIPGVGIDEFPKEWFAGVPPELYRSRRYSTAHNRYRVKSGLDQAGWEESGWISPTDPRGWTQWYFRFYMGRRLDDGEDERQIGRWNGVAGEKGRWKGNLIGKCLAAGAAPDDESVSPVVRQTLLHWAYELTEADFGKGAGRVIKKGAAYMPRDQLAHVMKKGAAGSSSGDRGTPPDEADGRIATERRKKAEEASESREKRAAKRKER